jgi:hypothetical protein
VEVEEPDGGDRFVGGGVEPAGDLLLDEVFDLRRQLDHGRPVLPGQRRKSCPSRIAPSDRRSLGEGWLAGAAVLPAGGFEDEAVVVVEEEEADRALLEDVGVGDAGGAKARLEVAEGGFVGQLEGEVLEGAGDEGGRAGGERLGEDLGVRCFPEMEGGAAAGVDEEVAGVPSRAGGSRRIGMPRVSR